MKPCVLSCSGVGDAYGVLKNRKTIEFMSTSYMRGVTFDNAIVLVDEIQNLNFQEISTVMTRIGKNTRVILCGDNKQDDLITRINDKSSYDILYKMVKHMPSFDLIKFEIEDIVRSGFVKEWLIAREKLGL